MEGFVTDADLKAWCPWHGARDYEPDFKLSITERRKRYGFGKKKQEKVKVKFERKPKPVKLKPIKVKPETEAAKQRYQKSLDIAESVNKALDLVTNKLKYDLSSWDTLEQRMHRAQGWHIFCQCINVLYPTFSVRGVSDALTVPNAPSRPTLSNMFENCRESPYSFEQIKKMLEI